MTPREKAYELVDKFKLCTETEELISNREAKKCALIAAEELIITVNMCIPYLNKETYMQYWQQVKTEIKNL